MRPPTANIITQGLHGQFNAVDYGSHPDPIFYAPEDVTYHWYGNSGDCGNNLQVNGATGRHGFCHLEETYIKPGQTVKKGEPLGKMGYTGKTKPPGEKGRHLHWVLLVGDTYIYPPSLVKEEFGGDMYEGRSAEDWATQAKDAEKYKQAVVKSKSWKLGMQQNPDFILPVIDGNEQFKQDTLANPNKAAQKLEKIKEIVKD